MEGKAFVNGKVVCGGIVSAQLVSMNRGKAGADSTAEAAE
jgi:hypothetical protein